MPAVPTGSISAEFVICSHREVTWDWVPVSRETIAQPWTWSISATIDPLQIQIWAIQKIFLSQPVLNEQTHFLRRHPMCAVHMEPKSSY